MGESKVSINDILLENIDKEILINFILSCNTCQTLPLLVKHLLSLNLKITSMKIMAKQPKHNWRMRFYGKWSSSFLMRQKKKDTVMNVFAVFTMKFLLLKVKLAFYGRKWKKKTMSLEHCSDETPVNSKVAVHVKVLNLTTLLKNNEELRDTCISTTSNPSNQIMNASLQT